MEELHVENTIIRWRPLAFFSKALQPAVQRYSTFGRELLAAYLSVKHFRHYAEGGRLLVFTDHKPLISAMASHSSKYTERKIRQLDFLCQFDLEFRHVRGSENEVADALSRVEINSLQFPPGIDYTDYAIFALIIDQSLKIQQISHNITCSFARDLVTI